MGREERKKLTPYVQCRCGKILNIDREGRDEASRLPSCLLSSIASPTQLLLVLVRDTPTLFFRS
jgi:hypothetical protein